MPPPEHQSIRGNLDTGVWSLNYQSTHIGAQRPRWGPRTSRAFLASIVQPIVPVEEEGSTDEISFRRVHLIPYQGDLLEALFRTGRKCRELLIKFCRSDGREGVKETADFSAQFDKILDEFEELKDTGISPLADLARRAGPHRRKKVVYYWMQKTALILNTVPHVVANADANEQRIKDIVSWLESGPPFYEIVEKGQPVTKVQHPCSRKEYWNGIEQPYQHYRGLMTQSSKSSPVQGPYLFETSTSATNTTSFPGDLRPGSYRYLCDGVKKGYLTKRLNVSVEDTLDY